MTEARTEQQEQSEPAAASAPASQIDQALAAAQSVRLGIEALQEHYDQLLAFAKSVIEDCWHGTEVCGSDIQEWAESNKLIVEVTATQEDVESGIECDVGDPIYKFSPWMREVLARRGLED